ncbi:putative oxidoreductase [Variovorax sp. PBL-H6]|uniref:SDR family oxidoreductase n=1 Tax=Variovorax sp. PBL-H6 TaxID=434009 RepID=UPI001318A03F|nr:SDR family NAD(P)-dependent oxidoreductase [Variovorax sp. PBL-H6]VTU15801.1 putative oxidoreductase [Variovorax sp. PBL-H6]
MSGIQHKVIAIAGASSGIGEAAARLLAAQGAKVMLGARRIGRLYALAHEIARAGGSAHYQVLDVARRASMRCFIDEATRVFGRVDVIVDNVGVMPLSMLDELSAGATVITPGSIGSEADGASEALARAIALAIERRDRPGRGAHDHAAPGSHGPTGHPAPATDPFPDSHFIPQ